MSYDEKAGGKRTFLSLGQPQHLEAEDGTPWPSFLKLLQVFPRAYGSFPRVFCPGFLLTSWHPFSRLLWAGGSLQGCVGEAAAASPALLELQWHLSLLAVLPTSASAHLSQQWEWELEARKASAATHCPSQGGWLATGKSGNSCLPLLAMQQLHLLGVLCLYELAHPSWHTGRQQSDKMGCTKVSAASCGGSPRKICGGLCLTAKEWITDYSGKSGRWEDYLGGSQGTFPYWQRLTSFRMIVSIICALILLLF